MVSLTMIPRDAEKIIRSLLHGFAIITIIGPRQAGKTTLANVIFTDKLYASLEDPDTRLFAKEDPRSFLEHFPNGAGFDKVQLVQHS